jgi:lipopolysaccharide/colanic/teichoic acid biosynthesis glycosyltransferase
MKRLFDLSFGGLVLAILSPILIFAMIILMCEDPRKVFFIQDRLGRDGKVFRLIKLRSMKKNRKGQPVVTLFGRWLRKFRIDEIPQLVNVIQGEMSLVGPRPEIAYFADRCRRKIPFYDLIYSVKPGLTGWAQVNFRYTTSMKDYEHKFRYNLFYLKNMSFILDLLILIKTIKIILLGKGQ